MVAVVASRWLFTALISALLTPTNGVRTLVVLLPPSEGEEAEANASPLAPALESVIRLGVEHVNSEGVLLEDKEVTVFTHARTGLPAVASLCESIESNNSIVAVVSALNTFSTAMMGSLSNEYLDLPIIDVGGTAARAESRNETLGGYVLQAQPVIVAQMQAMVRLILDMKLARDALDGRAETTERVWLVHTSDTFGTIATSAFNSALNISVPLPVTSSDVTEVDDDGNEEVVMATVEVAGTVVIAASSEAVYDSELALLVESEASIVVLLAEGFDGSIVRTFLSQANDAGLTEGVQWYLPNVAAFDHIFDVNSTYRDASLAFDMQGMLGVRSCTPRTGAGSAMAEALSQEWVRLDPNEYPGAGPDGVTADGQIDPFLAFAYDSVFLAAAAAQTAQETINLRDGGNLTGIALDRCPFPTNGSWADGVVMRDSVLSASTTLVGVTGPLVMSVGEDDDGRDVDTATFCAVNLRPHATQGGRFEVISTLDGGTLESDDGEGFQAISPFQETQTFPAGALKYPTDRPILQGRHLDVVMKRDAPPFVFVDGEGTTNDEYTGITSDFLKKLSEVVGFTYTLSAPADGTATSETIEMVRNGTVNMAASWITITSERAEYVSFTYPYFDLGISFVYKPEYAEGGNLWKAFAPFESTLWLTIFVALLVTVFLLWLFEGAKNDQFSRGGWGRRHRTIARGLSRSVYVTSSLMMSQLTHKPETLEGYLLTLGWLFTSFVLAASYTAELASYLTASKLETTSLSVDALLSGEISHSKVALLQGGYTQAVFERDFQKCDGLEECSLGVQPLACFSTSECFTMVLNGTALTTLADSATAEYELQNNFCGLTTLPDVLYPQHYGLVLPYGSGLTEELQAATLQLREDGTLGDIEDTYLDASAVCVPVTTSDEDSSNMTIADVSGVFFVLGLFVAIAVVSWTCRRSPWAKRFKERRRRANDGGAEQSVIDTYAKMSRQQQKAFAMQATINLLQHSKELSASSKTMAISATGDEAKEDSDAPTAPLVPGAAAQGAGGGGARRSGRREAGFRREIAEGRPVVTLGGGDSFTRRGLSLGGLFSRLSGRHDNGGVVDNDGHDGNPAREQQQQQKQGQQPWYPRNNRRYGGGASGAMGIGGSAGEGGASGGMEVDPDPMMFMGVGGANDSWSSSGSSPPPHPPLPPLGASSTLPRPATTDAAATAASSKGLAWLARTRGAPVVGPPASDTGAERGSAVPETEDMVGVGSGARTIEGGSNRRGSDGARQGGPAAVASAMHAGEAAGAVAAKAAVIPTAGPRTLASPEIPGSPNTTPATRGVTGDRGLAVPPNISVDPRVEPE